MPPVAHGQHCQQVHPAPAVDTRQQGSNIVPRHELPVCRRQALLCAVGLEVQDRCDASVADGMINRGESRKDSTIISGVDQDGQLRYNGRKELDAIEALQADVIDPSDDQSTAAVLDKVSGAGLIRAHQQQARIQFLAAIVEQMVVDNKRSRDTEAAVMNMRLLAMRDGRAAGGAVVAGAADDLRTWRQP